MCARTRLFRVNQNFQIYFNRFSLRCCWENWHLRHDRQTVNNWLSKTISFSRKLWSPFPVHFHLFSVRWKNLINLETRHRFFRSLSFPTFKHCKPPKLYEHTAGIKFSFHNSRIPPIPRKRLPLTWSVPSPPGTPSAARRACLGRRWRSACGTPWGASLWADSARARPSSRPPRTLRSASCLRTTGARQSGGTWAARGRSECAVGGLGDPGHETAGSWQGRKPAEMRTQVATGIARFRRVGITMCSLLKKLKIVIQWSPYSDHWRSKEKWSL